MTDQKVAIITGGSSGIGRATAIALAKERVKITVAALEYAKSGIRINAVAPGGVETDMVERLTKHNKQWRETLRSMHPIGHNADPKEIANAVVWLLSDKASFVLGHTLLVDGGLVSR